MKRQEKQRMKAERRAQRSLAKRAEAQSSDEIAAVPSPPEPQGSGANLSKCESDWR